MANHPSNNFTNNNNNRFNVNTQLVTQFLIDELLDDSDEHVLRAFMARRRRRTPTLIREPIIRDRQAGHDRIFEDYFSDNCVYTSDIFHRRFRMQKNMFIYIMNNLSERYEYFQLRNDAAGVVGLSTIQKCTAAIKQLAYGNPPDSYDEYIQIGETTAKQCLFNFCHGVNEIFGPRYLRRPNEEDVARLLQLHSDRHGFPGMLGSLDSGSNNDINVLRQSPLFNDVVNEFAPEVSFLVSGTRYSKGYYLVDGIYPEWATFVKSFPHPMDPKRILFKTMQESARKDIERAFGVLQARWAIIRTGARFWDRGRLKDIMYACIILHNMIVVSEGEDITNWESDIETSSVIPQSGLIGDFQDSLHRRAEIRDRDIHNQLKANLVEHIWQHFGDHDI